MQHPLGAVGSQPAKAVGSPPLTLLQIMRANVEIAADGIWAVTSNEKLSDPEWLLAEQDATNVVISASLMASAGNGPKDKAKQANADYVRKQFGLAVSRGPIFGLVARLVHQKGIDLVLSAADEIVEAGGQIVVTGSGEPSIERALVEAHRRRPQAIGVQIGFNDAQARRIFAGSDFTLMPSRFEPCGLSQMYAQRF